MPTEYGGDRVTRNSVQGLGPEERKLETSEQSRLFYLTGQTEDPDAPPKPEFFRGNDDDFGGDGLRKR